MLYFTRAAQPDKQHIHRSSNSTFILETSAFQDPILFYIRVLKNNKLKCNSLNLVKLRHNLCHKMKPFHVSHTIKCYPYCFITGDNQNTPLGYLNHRITNRTSGEPYHLYYSSTSAKSVKKCKHLFSPPFAYEGKFILKYFLKI